MIIHEMRLLDSPIVYVEVVASFNLDGKITPREILWESGEVFIIDKVKEVRTAASTKGGGAGVRYTVMINGHQRHLFRTISVGAHGCTRWFVEARR